MLKNKYILNTYRISHKIILSVIFLTVFILSSHSQVNIAATALTTSGDPYPENGMCPVSGRTLQVKIVNNGINPLDVTSTPVTITVNITGPINQTFSTILNSGTPILAGFSKYVNVTTAGDFSSKGTYSVAMSATCSGDASSGVDQLETFKVEGNKLTLTSLPTTTAQTVCLNSPVTSIVYSVSANATSASVTGLPPGVTSSFIYPNLTITGSPSSLAGSPFSYSVTSSGLCPVSENETLNGSMIVKALPVISIVDKTNDTLTCNDPLFIYNAVGGNTYTWSTGATSSNISVSTPGKYILTGTANGCSNKDSIDVKQNITPPNPPVGTDASRCGPGTLNLNVTSDAKTTVTWYASNQSTIVGSGLNYNTPSISSTTSYYAEAKNTSTGCVSTKSEVKGIIIPFNTAGAPSTTPTICVNSILTPITHNTTGATGIGTPTGLPLGINASFNVATGIITISGSPSSEVGSPFNYSIPLTGGCGTINATGTITVNPTNTVSSPTTTSLCINTSLSPLTHTTTGATGIATTTTNYGLPTGVSASFNSGTITIIGTPTTTAGSPFSYNIPLTGGCGNVIATGTITVNPNNTVSAPATATSCINIAISPLSHTTTGATGIASTTTNYGLPTGLSASFNPTTGIITISGTPTTTTGNPFNYTIPLTGGCGTFSATGTITVNPTNTVTGPLTASSCISVAMNPLSHTTTGATGIASTTTNYGLPTGLSASFNVGTSTITISGTPTTSTGSPFSYSIPLTGGCGTVNATGTIAVNPNNTTTGPATATNCINTSLTPYTHSTTGATGIASTTTNYGLPTGVSASFNASTGTISISGTPTVSTGSPYSYSIPLTGGCGTVNASGTITVNPNNTVTGPESATLCINTTLNPITHLTTGATGIAATTTNYGLPSGVSASFNAGTGIITISGTPTVSTNSPYSYTIPLTGGCGTFSATGTITVNLTNTASGPLTISSCINVPMTSVTQTTTGATGIAGTTTNYGLPTGVSATFNSSTGVILISGTPSTTVGSPFSYSIPLTGGCGTISASGTLTVNPKPVISPISGKINLCVGEKSTLSSATINGEWTSSSPLIASIDKDNGEVTAIKSGSTDISYTVVINQCSSTITTKVDVFDLPIVNEITGSDSLCVGDQLTLANASPDGVWSTDNNSVASVVNGVVDGKSVGKTKINYTVTTNGCSTIKSKEIVVNSYPVVPAIENVADVCVASTIQLTNTNTLGNWSSSDPTIASINAFGLVTGKSAGSVVISYKVTNLNCVTTKTANITVKQAIGVSPIVGTTDICIGANSQLTNTTTGGTWSSSNTAVATVNPTTGLVSSVAIGTTIIKYDVVTNGVCPQSTAVTFTVNEIPTVNALSNISVCQGSNVNAVNFSGTGSSVVYQWTNTKTNIGLEAKGTGNIGSFIAKGTTIGGGTEIAIINVTPIANGCAGSSKNFTITVNPLDNAGFNYLSSSFCKLDANPSPVISGLTGGVFSSSSTNLVLNSSSGKVDLANSTPGYYQITYTTNGSCPNDSTINFAVSSIPTVSPTSDQQVCDGSDLFVNFSGSPGTIFNWTNDKPIIGLPSSGIGNVTTFTAAGTTIGGSVVIGKIVVTPISGSCIGQKDTFLLKVMPKDDPTFTFPSNSFCSTRDPNPIANITGKAGGTFSMSPSGAIFNANTGAITLSSSNSGSYTLTYTTDGTCPNSQTFNLNIGSNPSVNIVSNQTICSGTSFNAINFTGNPGTTYEWKSNNSALIGLASSGTGNIASFIGSGATQSSPTISSVITVTPKVGTCIGASTSFNLAVKYKDDVAISYSEPSFCFANSNPAPTITGVQGGVFSATPIGLIINSSTGLVDINASSEGVYEVKYQTSGSCGANTTTPLAINNNPLVNNIPDQTICSGISFTDIIFTGTPGTVYHWTNSNPAIGLATSGTGNISSFIGTNNGSSPISSIITVSPKSGACPGGVKTFNLTVNPTSDPTFTYNTNPICQNAINILPSITGTTGGTFSSTAGLVLNSSTGEINLTTSTPGLYNIVYTTSGSCFGVKSYPLTINPIPTVNSVSDMQKCEGSLFDPISFTGTVGASFNWINSNPAIGLASSGTGNIASFKAKGTTIGGNTANAVITVTPSVNGCKGASKTFILNTNSKDNPGYVYSNNSYCFTESNPTPTITGNTGLFTISPSGLTIDPSTGTLDLSSAVAGSYQVKYTTNGMCKSDSTVTISVGEAPSVQSVSDTSVCQESTFNAINFKGSPGAIFEWTNSAPTIGLVASGTGNISSFIAKGTTIGGSNINATITVTPKVGSCKGSSKTFLLTVKSLDNASFSYSNSSFCKNESNPNPTITGLAGGTFTSSPVGISMSSNGTINLAASSSGSYNISYTTIGGQCPNVSTFPISIGTNPTVETVNGLYDQTVCVGSDFSDINFKGNAGTEFIWENKDNIPGLALNGKGDIKGFKALNAGVYTISVSPVTGTCPPGVSKTLKLIVNNITSSTISYGQSTFCVSDKDPTLVLTGPLGGVFSSTPAGLSINSSTGAINLQASTVGNYTISYNLFSQCSTSSSTSFSVGSSPFVDPILNDTLCNGATINKKFKGSIGSQFDWTNLTPALLKDLPASGRDSIPTFVGENKTSSLIISEIEVTPKAGSCIGSSKKFKIVVRPSDNSNFSYSKNSYCKNDSDPTPNFAVSQTGTFISNPTGLNININTGKIDLSATNPGTYNVTFLTKGVCPQASTSSITVNPIPFVNSLLDTSKCQGLDFEPIQLTGSASPTTFEWVNDKPAIGLISSGVGIIPKFKATGTLKNGPKEEGVITVTPKINGCIGASKTFKMIVNSLDDASFKYAKTSICQNDLNNPIPTFSGTTGGTFTATPTGLTLNSTTGVINKSTSAIGTYSLTYTTNRYCKDDSTVSIVINPEPIMNTISNIIQNRCFGSSFDPIIFTGTNVDKYKWINDKPAIGLAASGEGNINAFVAKGTVFGGNPIVGNITVTPEINGCTGVVQTVILTVNPIDNPAFNYSADSYCTKGTPTDPLPTISGTNGGSFASTPTGLKLNSLTGLISLGTSTPGTYQITYTTPGSCKDDSTVTIGIGSEPTVDDVDDQSYCQGDMFDPVVFTGNLGTIFDWVNITNTNVGLVSPGKGNIKAFKATGTIDGGSDIFATIKITPRIGTCTGPTVNFKYRVRANPKIVASISNTSKQDTSFCKGGSAILNAVGASKNENYVWTPHTSLVGNLGIGSTVTTKTDTTQQYIVRGQSQFGCYNYDTLLINIYNPTVNQKLDTTVCSESFVNKITFESKLNGTTFDWENNNTTIGLNFLNGIGNINSFKAVNSSSSVNEALISVTPKFVIQSTNKTCEGPKMKFKIRVNKVDDASFDGYLGQYCANETSNTIPVIKGSIGGVFSSSPTGLALKSNTGEIFPISSKTGSYTVKYTTPGVCPKSNSVNLFINPLVSATISGADTVCVNAVSPKIKFKGANGVAPYRFQYKLNNGAVQIISSDPGKDEVTLSVPTNKAGVFSYELISVEESSLSLCKNANVFGVQTVLINELPLAQITTTSTSVCAGGASPEIRITGVNGVSPFTFTYFISKDGNPFGTAQNISTTQGQFLAKIPVNTVDPGVYNYTVNMVKNGDELSCSNNVNISQTVTIKPLPNGRVNASPSGVCMNGDANIEFSALNGSPPFTFVYSINNGGNQTIKSANSDYNVILKANTNISGTFNYKIISVSDGDATSCQNNNVNNAIDLFVTPGTKVNKVQDLNVCVNEKSDTIEFTGGVNGTVYNWYSNNITVGISGSGSGNILPFVSKNNSGSTTNISRITVIPSVGQCKGDTMKFDIVVRPKPKAKINAPNTVCPGDSIKLEGLGSELKYVWTPNVSCITCNPVIAKPTENTTYKAFVTDKYNCFDSTEFDVVVYPRPDINIDEPVVCGEPELVILKGKDNNTYTFSDGKFDGVPFMPNKGKTSYIVNVKDNLGCKNSDTVNVYVIERPKSKFTATPEYGLASDVKPLNVLLSNLSSNSNEFEWHFRNGEEIPLIKNTLEPVTALYKKPGIYVLTLIAKNAKCIDSSSISIKIDKLDTPRVEIAPNVFTPDNDGTNDEFFITVKNAKDIHIMIFNRWGNPVYEMTETSQSWDGRINGKDADEGVYYYQYEIEGTSGEKIKGQGYVQLIRK